MAKKSRKKKKTKKKSTGLDSHESSPTEIPRFLQLVVETPVAKLDLHGLTADQAERRLLNFIRTQSRLFPGRVVHIVTGKGARSTGAPVLPAVTQNVLGGELSDLVREIAGLPGGGALAVRLS